MKNLLSIGFVFILIALTMFFCDNQRVVASFFTQGECEFVVDGKKNADVILPPEAKAINNGNTLIISAPASISRFLYNSLFEIKGITFFTSQSLQSVVSKLNIKVFKGVKVEGAEHFYGFCTGLDKFVFVDGKKVNVHLVKKKDQLIVGFPIILGSY